MKTLDGNADVISRMALVFNVEVEVHELIDGIRDSIVRWTEKDSVVDINDKDNVPAIKHAVIHKRWCETNLPQLLNEKSVPYPSSLFLTIDVGQQLEDVLFGVCSLDNDALRELQKR